MLLNGLEITLNFCLVYFLGLYEYVNRVYLPLLLIAYSALHSHGSLVCRSNEQNRQHLETVCYFGAGEEHPEHNL